MIVTGWPGLSEAKSPGQNEKTQKFSVIKKNKKSQQNTFT
jgi:hypothetical protein